MNHNRFPLLYMGSDIHKVSPYSGHQPTSATDLGFAIPALDRLLHEADIVVRLKSRADSPGNPMTNTEFDTLEDTYATFFPLFLQGIKQVRNINRNDKAVAMLTALGLKPGQIQCLTELSSSKITNSKTKINKDLFGESSASTLYNNLSLRYGF